VGISTRFKHVEQYLDERTRRLLAAAEAMAAGKGSIRQVSLATGVARNTIRSGIKELNGTSQEVLVPGLIRAPGGGRKRVDEKNPDLMPALEKLVAPATRGDPTSPLRWTSKSTVRLADELESAGFQVSSRTVARLLSDLGYSLQSTKKSLEPRSSHPDRNAQFEFISQQASERMEDSQPVLSVDTKKKELVGDFRNNGREYQPKGNPELVQIHDFITDSKGRATPYGVYDIAQNAGWVSVGTDHDTAAFAVESIRQWWKNMGAKVYPEMKSLLITADSGGSNGSRLKLWKLKIQLLADEWQIPITICHFPPGTSKWNKIEHRLFSHITMNWRGKPLVSHEAIVSLIAHTTTSAGLKIKSKIDKRKYPLGQKVSKQQMEELNIEMIGPHDGWSYTISPRS
jgi:transposase